MTDSPKIPEQQKDAEIDKAWEAHNNIVREPEIRMEWRRTHLKDQDGKCYFCECPITDDKEYEGPAEASTLDHIIPRSKGGEDIFENTVAACEPCNTRKSDMSLNDYLAHPLGLTRLHYFRNRTQ